MPARKADEARAHADALVEKLRAADVGPSEIADVFWELDFLPADVVRAALVSWLGAQSEPPVVGPRRLVTLASVRDADVLDLGRVAEEQLRIAGTSWDGLDLEPEERLDGEREDSFAGTLEHRVLADAETNAPVYDVLLYAEQAGVVFEAGTTNLVARIADGHIEARDPAVRAALEPTLAPEPAPKRKPRSSAPPKSAAAPKKRASRAKKS
ncbi:MAG TPA: hypothetical protein VIF62_00660 [Labilithrix sp.]